MLITDAYSEGLKMCYMDYYFMYSFGNVLDARSKYGLLIKQHLYTLSKNYRW
jgi:hypothetical protein